MGGCPTFTLLFEYESIVPVMFLKKLTVKSLQFGMLMETAILFS